MKSSPTYVIAEAGVNHNGSLDMARELIDVAAEAGADAVKFQTFKADKLVTRSAAKAAYQTQTTDQTESQFEMIRKLELDDEAHDILIAHCRKRGIEFLSTPFDLDSVELLANRAQLSLLKIPSGEITNASLLLAIARTGKPVILSTGMSTLGEIEDALGVLAFGYLLGGEKRPSLAAFRETYRSDAGQSELAAKVVLLHCTTEYPAPFAEVNLRALDTMRDAFGLPVGLSDHTPGIAVAIAAAAREAAVIEKHFTLDRNLPGPDHKASLEPAELKEMVQAIRVVGQALGTGVKRPAPSEAKNIEVARRSLVAARRIAAGERLSVDNMTSKRPGSGISAMMFYDWLDKTAEKAYEEDELLT